MPTIAKCRFVLVPVCLLLCALVSLWSASPRPLALRPPRRCDSALQPWEWRDEEEPGDEFAPDARSRTRWQVEAESDERGGELLAGARIVDNLASGALQNDRGAGLKADPIKVEWLDFCFERRARGADSLTLLLPWTPAAGSATLSRRRSRYFFLDFFLPAFFFDFFAVFLAIVRSPRSNRWFN